MRRLLVVVLLAGLLATTAQGATRAKKVKVGDDFFVRDGRTPIVQVVRDRRVQWVWTGDDSHDVRVTRGPVKFHSKLKRSGTYTRKLTKLGTYTIVCSIHDGMEMKLKVTSR